MERGLLGRVRMPFVAAVIVAGLLGVAFAGEDGELWTSFKVRGKVNEEVSYYVTPGLRYRDNWDDRYYERYDFGVNCKLGEHWSVEPFYSYLRKEGSSGWNQSDLLSLHVYYKTAIEAWDAQLESRTRLEKNFDTEREAGRERLKLTRKLDGFEGVSVFACDEIIYDFSGGDFKENRLGIGIKKSLTENLSMDVAYQLTSVRTNGHWVDADTVVVGFGLSI